MSGFVQDWDPVKVGQKTRAPKTARTTSDINGEPDIFSKKALSLTLLAVNITLPRRITFFWG